MTTYQFHQFLVRIRVRPRGWMMLRDSHGDIKDYRRPYQRYEEIEPLKKVFQ